MSDRGATKPLAAYIDVKHGFAFEGRYFCDEPTAHVLVTPGNFAVGGGFQDGKAKYYNGPIPEDYVLHEGDLIVTMTDLSKAGDTLGYPALIPETHNRLYLHNQRIGLVSITDSDSLDHDYLYYLLRTDAYRNHILATASGSTVRHTSPSRIREFAIGLPALKEQRAAAEVLRALDDKIEQNRRTARELEGLARATFKAWFVDFEPVKAKAAGQTSFPGMPPAAFAALPNRFTDSTLGPIPQGWHSTDLGSEFDFQVGFTFKSIDFTDASDAIRLVRGDNVKEGWIEWGSKTRRWNSIDDEINRYHLCIGDVVIGMDGSKLGKNWARVREFDLPSLLVQRVARFRSTRDAGSSLLWLLISHPAFRHFVDAVKTGTSIPHISGGQLKSFTFIKPEVSAPVVWTAFEEVVAPLLALADHAAGESSKLAALRDYLLPRLLSGKVRVSQTHNVRIDANF